MASPHPGSWELLLTQSDCQLDTISTAIHAAVFYDPVENKNWEVLYFAIGVSNIFKSYIWDPDNPTEVIGPQDVPNWPQGEFASNIFCSGHTHMPDGRLLVAGGSRGSIIPEPPCPQVNRARGIPYTFFFDPIEKEWQIAGPGNAPHSMHDGRYYPTITTLGDDPHNESDAGITLAMGGLKKNLDGCYSAFNKDPELYFPDTGWSFFPEPERAEQPFNGDYMGAHLVPYGNYSGMVFYSMPMLQARMFNPFPDLQVDTYWDDVGSARSIIRSEGCSVLLPLLPDRDSSKVMIFGGGNPGTDTAEVIDLSDSSPGWSSVSPMFHARRNPNTVLLPDDKILVIGGNLENQTIEPVYTAELYDIGSDEWTLLPAMNRPRVYHSVAILLPDGRVWVGGSQGGSPSIVEKNIEIYYPGYLFEGERPEIVQCPDEINYDTQFYITASTEIEKIRLIRLSSVTHSTDFEQRSVGLSFQEEQQSEQLIVDAPVNANIAPPGFYMLFALRLKSASLSGETSIPSVAKIVKLSY